MDAAVFACTAYAALWLMATFALTLQQNTHGHAPSLHSFVMYTRQGWPFVTRVLGKTCYRAVQTAAVYSGHFGQPLVFVYEAHGGRPLVLVYEGHFGQPPPPHLR